MILALAVCVYATALTLANVSVFAFGPKVMPFNSFILIGLDLSLRDWLHVRISAPHMGILILASGLITYLLAPAAGIIAIASAVAFSGAAVVDWTVFSTVRGTWMLRSNCSNVAGAAVDSILFPTIAFGTLMPLVVLAQFVAKVSGGLMWSWLLRGGTHVDRLGKRAI